jgi:N-acetylneuraminic acid mutarotase
MKRKNISILLLLFLSSVCIFPNVSFSNLLWTTKTSMPTERYDMAAGMVGGIIYVIGGGPGFVPVYDVEAYDPGPPETWTAKADMPYNMHRLAAAVINDTIYTCGGWYGMGVKPYTLEYDPFSDSWTQKSDMPAVRQYHAAASADGKMYAIGGAGPVNTCFEYDPKADTTGGTPWITKTPMPTARYALAAVEVGGKIYVIGGDNGSGVLGTVEEYDPLLDSWNTKTAMPTPRRFLTACVKADTIFTIGGIDDSKAYHSTVEKYVPATDSWYTDTPMPTARRAPISSVVNGIIYVIGGDNGSALDTTEAAEPQTALELSTFYTEGKRGEISLYWRTHSEQEITTWIIKRSCGDSFTTIATLPAQHSSPTPNTYYYSDNSVLPSIQYLYKLGAYHTNSKIQWFGPVAGTSLPPSPSTSILEITPHIFTDKVEIFLTQESATEFCVEIYSLSGRKVIEFKGVGGKSQRSILTWRGKDRSGFPVPAGLYFITVRSGSTIESERIIKIQ